MQICLDKTEQARASLAQKQDADVDFAVQGRKTQEVPVILFFALRQQKKQDARCGKGAATSFAQESAKGFSKWQGRKNRAAYAPYPA